MAMRIQTVQSRRAQAVAKRRIRRNGGLVVVLLLCAVVGYWDQNGGNAMPQSGQIIHVYHTETAQLMPMDLETYLVGVVAAEMPASFELEALKAQAVAARTFAVNRMLHPNQKVTALHPDAHITTSPETCQAWIDDDTQKERWGGSYELWHNKIVQAVSETCGEVLYYDGTLIEPVYHASCGGGFTEAAEHVWGTAKPYLVSVACYHPADKHSGEVTTVTLQEFAEKMQLQGTAAVTAMRSDDAYIKVTEKTETNRVKQVQIGDYKVRGGALRSALGLKSTLMDWKIADGVIVFTTNGYGHGAGMCQHGADYYAAQGYRYQQILQHYYPGTVLGSV